MREKGEMCIKEEDDEMERHSIVKCFAIAN
jgi:hypothetical protein